MTQNSKQDSMDQTEGGADTVVTILTDIDHQIALKRQRECPVCQEEEWLYPNDPQCWRCDRIERGLCVAKPEGANGWLWWNYTTRAWAPQPVEPDDTWGIQEDDG